MSRLTLRRRTVLAAAILLAALVVLLFLIGMTPRKTAARAPSEVASGLTQTGQRLRLAEVAPPIVDAGVDAEPDPATAPPGHIVYRRVSLDDLREAQGLPIASPPLAELDSFRSPTSDELSDPNFLALYQIDRRIHRAKLLAEHEGAEGERFLRDAERAIGSEWKESLLRAAKQHGELSARYRASVPRLEEERGAMVQQIVQHESGATRR